MQTKAISMRSEPASIPTMKVTFQGFPLLVCRIFPYLKCSGISIELPVDAGCEYHMEDGLLSIHCQNFSGALTLTRGKRLLLWPSSSLKL